MHVHVSPAQTHPELLARGSGFFSSSPSGRLFALSSAHVAAPHRFPKYFPAEWLLHVRDEHCSSEFRLKDGTLLADGPLRAGFRHGYLDVAAFALRTLPESTPMPLKLADAELGAKVLVIGLRLQGGEAGSGTERVEMTEIRGEITKVLEKRGFVDCKGIESEMGMCGGPVVLEEQRDVCVGMLEGVVPSLQNGETEISEEHKRILGHSVFITSNELRLFLEDADMALRNAMAAEKAKETR